MKTTSVLFLVSSEKKQNQLKSVGISVLEMVREFYITSVISSEKQTLCL